MESTAVLEQTEVISHSDRARQRAERIEQLKATRVELLQRHDRLTEDDWEELEQTYFRLGLPLAQIDADISILDEMRQIQSQMPSDAEKKARQDELADQRSKVDAKVVKLFHEAIDSLTPPDFPIVAGVLQRLGLDGNFAQLRDQRAGIVLQAQNEQHAYSALEAKYEALRKSHGELFPDLPPLISQSVEGRVGFINFVG